MMDFITEHKQEFFQAAIVIGIVFILLVTTNLWIKWVIKKLKLKYPNRKPSALLLVRRILRVMWIVLGAIALSFIVFDKMDYETANKNFHIILYLGVVSIITIVAAASVNLYFKETVEKKRAAHEDYTSEKFLRYLVVACIYFIGGVVAILVFPSMRGVAQTALGGAGVLAVIAGVASQEALSNLVGGIFIIAFKPFRIGDTIEIDPSMKGTVADITLRHTVIRNYQNKMIVVPNAIMNKEKVVNYDLGERLCCQWIFMHISFDSDLKLAKHIMREECESHPDAVDNRSELDKINSAPKVVVRVTSLDDSAVVLRASVWAETFDIAFAMECDLYEIIKHRFDNEEIKIPYPHRTMVFKEKQLEELSSKLQKNETDKNKNAELN